MLDGLRERAAAWLCMHGHLDTEDRLFPVEGNPMKIWLQLQAKGTPAPQCPWRAGGGSSTVCLFKNRKGNAALGTSTEGLTSAQAA